MQWIEIVERMLGFGHGRRERRAVLRAPIGQIPRRAGREEPDSQQSDSEHLVNMAGDGRDASGRFNPRMVSWDEIVAGILNESLPLDRWMKR